MMISKPFATIKKKKGAGTEMCPAFVSGIATGEAPVSFNCPRSLWES